MSFDLAAFDFNATPFVPSSWQWEKDAKSFYMEHNAVFMVCAVLYYPTIFGIRYIMKDREAFDLGGAKTKCMINWIFWWEVALAIFSILGMIHVVPLALSNMNAHSDVSASICDNDVHSQPASVWLFYFMISKVFEFGDTIFVVLRKKPLILLQHYHHLATMLYCWWGCLHVYQYNNTNVYFAAMNFTVHSIMYTWYAATRTGWRSPKILMMFVTLIQLVQMIFGLWIVLVALSDRPGCGIWNVKDPVGSKCCLFMYFSYLVLFAKLFFENYIRPRPKKSSKKKL